MARHGTGAAHREHASQTGHLESGMFSQASGFQTFVGEEPREKETYHTSIESIV